MPAPKEILQLINRFKEQRDTYLDPRYNETQLRVEFLDPLFEILGWDVHNKQGLAEAYKDVIHEAQVKIGSSIKAPDYCFRIGGTRKFFLEAKKPAVKIGDDGNPAFQLRRYAWSAKLPLSVLSNFSELAVYDCRVKPSQTDKPSSARIVYLRCEDFEKRWDEFASVFSKEAVLKGSFDRYVTDTKKKRGTAEVDDEFLAELDNWRALLAKSIALRNTQLTQRELNFSVQQTIDRIIFLRIAEDRGIEQYAEMQALLNGHNVYDRLRQLFHRADDRYNSGLFHFHAEKGRHSPDELTPTLIIEDASLKQIIRRLYYPDSPYEFSVFPADILGQVYEQFLGKVIRLTASHRAVVEDKPEVKKAGGVYYTPTYIVDHIVKQTVGNLVQGKTPANASKLRILDPACGSGSFLLAAYQYLLDWHRHWYETNDPEKYARGRTPRIFRASGGGWHLTSNERKRILLDNIYGVDIDLQAVEVTKLSLLLKVLEEAPGETIRGLQLRERALPDLDDNIKCGNSLISSDFYDGRFDFDDDEQFRINAFDWDHEFPLAQKSGGFDAVIGNPPWISLSGKFGTEIYSPEQINYCIRHFAGNTYMPNMYEYFVSQGLNLTKKSGFFGFIVPDRFGFNGQFVALRKRMLEEAEILELVYKAPFPKVVADTLMFIVRKHAGPHNGMVLISEYGRDAIEIQQDAILKDPGHRFQYFESTKIMELVSKIDSLKAKAPIKDLCQSTSGFGGKSHLIEEKQSNNRQIPTLKGDSIGRYCIRKQYWFEFKRQNITGRTTDIDKLGASPKILLRKTGDRIIATYDESRVFPEQSLYFLYNPKPNIDFLFILGVLNSKTLNFYYRAKALTNKRSIAQVKKTDLDELPIALIDSGAISPLIRLVEQVLALNLDLDRAKTGHERKILERRIAAIEKQIDHAVYALYRLTKDEIALVESESP